MCGIAGWVSWDQDLRFKTPIIETMGASLAHRGPDDSGSWESENAAAAHCRLIVVDPQGGAQPMVRSRGQMTYVITYNGELYNTAQIQEELRGPPLRGQFYIGSST